MENLADISDQEACYYINKLKTFLGQTNIDRVLRRYTRIRSKAGPIIWQYYYKTQHPWLESFLEIDELQRTGKSVKRHLTHNIKQLVADGKRIDVLSYHMSATTQNKYRSDLLDFENARNFLFELRIAWHFYLKGYRPKWHDDDNHQHSEFVLHTPKCDIDVECKTISADICRQVHRQDFYRLADALIPEISDLGYAGRIDIILRGRLQRSHIKALVSQIVQAVKLKAGQDAIDIEDGSIALDLREPRNSNINLDEEYVRFHESLPDGTHGVVASLSQRGPRDPLQVTLKSDQADRVLDGIYNKLKDAMSSQLNRTMPGLVICFLEGVEDLRELAKDSGLQLVTSKLLNKEELSHVAGIGYSSEPWLHRHKGYDEYNNQALYFRNPECKYTEARDFDYMFGKGSSYNT